VTQPKQAMRADCANCPLLDWKNQLVPSSKGVEGPDLIVVADWPGHHEAFTKQPLTGTNLQVLNSVLSHYGIDTSRVYITNALLCHPQFIKDNPAQLEKAIAACRGRLQYTLEQFSADVPVLALGNWAQQALGIEPFRWQPEVLTGKWAIGTWGVAHVMAQPDKFYQFKRSLQKFAEALT
jgi:uracil-DNA glycosylase family 4